MSAQKVPQQLVDRMVALVRQIARVSDNPYLTALSYSTARAIAAELPDPDLIEARDVIRQTYGNTEGRGDGPDRVRAIIAGDADEYWEMRAVHAAIKRGRELERQS